MPYAPGISYHGDAYLAQAGQNISNDLLNAIDQYQKNQQQEAFSDSVMHHLAKTPVDPNDPAKGTYVPIDALNSYMEAPLKKKIGMAQAAQTSATSDFARTMQEQKAALEQAQASKANTMADAESNLYNAKANAIWTGQNENGGDGGAIKIDPYIEPTTKKPVAGMGIVHGPGNQFQVVNTQDQTQGPITDPSGKYQYRGPKLGWVPLPGATLVLPGVGQTGGATGDAAQQPASTFTVNGDSQAATAATPAPRIAASGAAPKVQTQADYDGLPSGTVFIAPDGSKRRKP